MKKLLLVLVIGSGALVSCKKNYTCDCTETETSGGDVDTSSWDFTIEEASQGQAEAACNEATIVVEDGDYKSERTCELSK